MTLLRSTPRTLRARPTGRALEAVRSALAVGLIAGTAIATLTACSSEPDTIPGSTGAQGLAPPQLDASQTPAPPPPSSLVDQRPVSRGEIERAGYTWGSDDAPIHVVEFSDFGCGYCRQFHMETFGPLLAEYVETGKVHWRFVPFNVGMFPNADGALMSGLCGGAQGKIQEMGDALFERQREWKRSGDVSAVFADAATSAGLDMTQWNACVAENQLGAVSAVNTNMARRLGIRGTPTFFVDGYPVPGALPIETFREVFDQLLEDRNTATGG